MAADKEASDIELLLSKGFKKEWEGHWMVPTCFKVVTTEQALKLANHPDFDSILALLS